MADIIHDAAPKLKSNRMSNTKITNKKKTKEKKMTRQEKEIAAKEELIRLEMLEKADKAGGKKGKKKKNPLKKGRGGGRGKKGKDKKDKKPKKEKKTKKVIEEKTETEPETAETNSAPESVKTAPVGVEKTVESVTVPVSSPTPLKMDEATKKQPVAAAEPVTEPVKAADPTETKSAAAAAPPPQTIPQLQNTTLDTNGDEKHDRKSKIKKSLTHREGVLVDTNEDGVLDSMAFDSTGDGKNDTVVGLEWNYIDNDTGEQFADLLVDQLLTKIAEGTFKPTSDTMFWNENLDEWTALGSLPDLQKQLTPPTPNEIAAATDQPTTPSTTTTTSPTLVSISKANAVPQNVVCNYR